jgi:hypothetical protein
MPYERSGPGVAADGLPRFDLTRFNQSYFDRLRARVAAARDRGIYVGVMLFQGWSVWHFDAGRNAWAYHPFRAPNNINGINGDPGDDGEGEETHSLRLPAITALQETYIRKVVDTLNDMDSVLFEISNETKPSASSQAWEYHMVEYIKAYEATKPRQHPVGVTSNSRRDSDVLSSSPSDWVSLRRINVGDATLLTDPPPTDGRRVILLDSDHLGSRPMQMDPTLARAWVWKSFTRGYNPIVMDNPTNPMADTSPGFVAAREAMGQTARYARTVNMATMMPRVDLSSSRFALADPGGAYLVYQPDRTLFTVDLSGAPGTYSVRWFDPLTGVTISGDTVEGDHPLLFWPPFSGDAVLHLTKQ